MALVYNNITIDPNTIHVTTRFDMKHGETRLSKLPESPNTNCKSRKSLNDLTEKLILTTLDNISLNKNVWDVAFVSKIFLRRLCERLKRKNDSFEIEDHTT